MVEGIAQIISQSERKVLVCSTSNSICDEIACRLLKSVPDADILRLYSARTKRKNIPAELFAIANYDEKGSRTYLPDWPDLKKKQAIVCTLFMSGRLPQAEVNIPADHFSHIFIDECAGVTEPDALTPITSMDRLTA